MPYPGQFHRLVMIGSIYTETFNMTLSIVPSALGEFGMPPVSDAELLAVATEVGGWFPSVTVAAGPFFTLDAKLTSIKLNRIGVDGRYVDNDTKEHIYTSPIAGGWNPGSLKPLPQQAHVVTLKTAIERGRGSRGRMYFVGCQGSSSLASDGRVTAADALRTANGARNLINRINNLVVIGGIGKVGVASNAGGGRFEHVTAVSVGRVVDTMRSRRSSLTEDYQQVAL